jgi:ankyrin repeat protein
LFWAAEYGHANVVRVLIERGADINAKAQGDATSLMWAARNGHLEVVICY